MFSGCKEFNQPLNTWNVSKVTNMSKMFENCVSFRQTLRPWAINDSINWQEISDVPFIVEDLTRKMNVKNKSDKIFEKLSSLDTFNLKNSELGQNTLQNELIKANIKSYLEKKSGGKSKKSKKIKKSKKSKKSKKKNIKY